VKQHTDFLGSVIRWTENVVVIAGYLNRSTNNLSSGIRWSLDLRWQNPAFPNGFYGLKPSILMAKSDQPEFQPDWKEWAQVERTSLQAQAVSIDENNADRVISTAQSEYLIGLMWFSFPCFFEENGVWA
jgi:hypothetical protein